MDLKSYKIDPKNGGPAKQAVLFLHGLGANGQDLLGISNYWQDVLPDAVFISPDAPFECDMAPGMPNSFQWFSLQSWDKVSILKGIKTAHKILNSYIEKILQKYDLKEENLALVGFSQGTMLSLYHGPRRGQKIGAILGYSGALFGGDGLSEANIHKPPICLIHGEADPIVPVAAWEQAKQTLETHGFDISGYTTAGLQHGIDEAGIQAGANFLQHIFS